MSGGAPFQVPGWYGKLPGMDDFGHRRVPIAFRIAWDRWLRAGLARLRVRRGGGPRQEAQAPQWCFVLGSDVIGARCWMGTMMPSMDRFGRHFPFAIVSELVSPPTELEGRALAYVRRWWTLATQAAVDGVRLELDADRFEERLHGLFADVAGFAPSSVAAAGTLTPLALPEPGQTLWFTEPGGRSGLGMASAGLPQDEQFEVLFGTTPEPARADVPHRPP